MNLSLMRAQAEALDAGNDVQETQVQEAYLGEKINAGT